MLAIRRLLAHRRLAGLVCTAALLLKLIVPAGYMIGSDHGRLAVTICTGMAVSAAATAMPGMHGDVHADMPGHDGSADHGKADHGRADQPCPFAGLSAVTLGATDPTLLALLVAFVMAVGVLDRRRPARADPAFLRPPLRGPPARL